MGYEKLLKNFGNCLLNFLFIISLQMCNKFVELQESVYGKDHQVCSQSTWGSLPN